MIMMDFEQGSQEWHDMRIRPTASRFKDLITSAGGKSASASRYLGELLAAYYGHAKPFFVTQAMQNGIDREPLALATYAYETDSDPATTGIILQDNSPFSPGYSPDALVGLNGLVEIKCPEAWTHIATVLNGVMPKEHVPQVQGGLYVSGREWCDFVSFCPLVAPEHQLFIARQHRDDKFISKLAPILDSASETLRRFVA